MDEVVLDASAVLAYIYGEPGAEVVASALDRAMVSSVNLSEVVAKLAESGSSHAQIRRDLNRLDMRIVPFDEDQAYRAGMLRPVTRETGLSLGDRACLALGQISSSPVVTAERIWPEILLDLEVRLIR